jgi:CRP-like cAMP-binding protein
MNAILKNKIDFSVSNFKFNTNLTMDALPETERHELEEQAKIIKLGKKAVLYAEGEPPKGVYVLLRGKIKISQLNHDGSVQILFIYAAGEFFGHRPILGNDRQPVSATALEDCELMFIEKDHFLNVLKNSAGFSSMMMQSLSHEFTLLLNRINIFAQRGIKERLALFLLILNETYRKPGQSNEEAEITVNRNDLACYTGTSVENLVRTLKVFKENNYVSTAGKSIFITDFEALYALTGI